MMMTTVKVSIVQEGSVLRLQAISQDKSYLPFESDHMSTSGDLEVTYLLPLNSDTKKRIVITTLTKGTLWIFPIRGPTPPASWLCQEVSVWSCQAFALPLPSDSSETIAKQSPDRAMAFHKFLLSARQWARHADCRISHFSWDSQHEWKVWHSDLSPIFYLSWWEKMNWQCL